jgi:hypothetical protein
VIIILRVSFCSVIWYCNILAYYLLNIGEYRIARDNICIIMWSCPGNMPKYYPGLRDILPDRNYYTECLIVQVICQNITVPNNTTETYTKYNNHQYSCNNPILLYGFVGLFSMVKIRHSV